MKSNLLQLFLLALIMAGSLLLSAHEKQGLVAVAITVKDQSGAVVPHAQIKIDPQPSTFPADAETNEHGALSIRLLPGSYDVFVTNPAFLPWTKHIEVQAQSDQMVGVPLQIADTTVRVEDCSCPPIPADAEALKQEPKSIPVTITISDASGAVIPHAQFLVSPRPATLASDPEADASKGQYLT
jgi:hypothetical protein